jgi:hypothetical protein
MPRGCCNWRGAFGEQAAPLEPAFLARMAEAVSNVASAGDGAKSTRAGGTMELNLEQVAAHYAISSVFSSFAEETDLFCFRVRRISYDIYTSGRGRLALGRAHIVSAITGQAAELLLCGAALWRPEHHRRRKALPEPMRPSSRLLPARPPNTCSAPTSPR